MRSSLTTIKFLLRTGAIPFLIVDYTCSSLSIVLCRENKYFYCQLIDEVNNACFCELCLNAVSVKAQPLTERELEDYISQATQLQLSTDKLTSDFFEEAMSCANSVYNLYLAKMTESDDKENDTFSETDFDVLSRLAKEMKDNEYKDKQ